jgi:hypothetical protein
MSEQEGERCGGSNKELYQKEKRLQGDGLGTSWLSDSLNLHYQGKGNEIVVHCSG